MLSRATERFVGEPPVVGSGVMVAWIAGGAALWTVAGAAVAFLVAAVLGRSCRVDDPAPAGEARILVPAQRTAPPTGPRSRPHLPCAGVGRSPSHR